MAYAQIWKVLHRNVHNIAAIRISVQSCKLFHTNRRAVSGVFRGGEASSSAPFSCCFIQTHRGRGFTLDATARNTIQPEDRDKSLSRFQGGSPRPSTAQKVKDAGRDFTYLIVVLVGFGVTGALLYVVFQELFSSSSPNKVYGKAFDKVKSHPEVIGALGEPLKCYGETTRRGRRQQVSHMEYLKDGLKHLRLKFYIEGSEPGLKGTVHSESVENSATGKYEFQYIIVNMDTYPRRTIIVEDNR